MYTCPCVSYRHKKNIVLKPTKCNRSSTNLIFYMLQRVKKILVHVAKHNLLYLVAIYNILFTYTTLNYGQNIQIIEPTKKTKEVLRFEEIHIMCHLLCIDMLIDYSTLQGKTYKIVPLNNQES